MGYMILRYGIHIVYKNGDEVEKWFSTEEKREREFYSIRSSKGIDIMWRKFRPKEVY